MMLYSIKTVYNNNTTFIKLKEEDEYYLKLYIFTHFNMVSYVSYKKLCKYDKCYDIILLEDPCKFDIERLKSPIIRDINDIMTGIIQLPDNYSKMFEFIKTKTYDYSFNVKDGKIARYNNEIFRWYEDTNTYYKYVKKTIVNHLLNDNYKDICIYFE